MIRPPRSAKRPYPAAVGMDERERQRIGELEQLLEPHGIRMPADPTPDQLAIAEYAAAWFAERDAARTRAERERQRIEALALDPQRKAEYDEARAACRVDVEARFPGWVPQTLTERQRASFDQHATWLAGRPPSWATSDPTAAAMRDEASRLHPMAYGRSREARALRAEITRLYQEASRRSRQESRRRRRETPGAWVRMVPWPVECQVCQGPIDPALAWPDPRSGSLGHEPPVYWVARHPEYAGALTLRPEHLACNLMKRDRPDWELPEPSDEVPDEPGRLSTAGQAPVKSGRLPCASPAPHRTLRSA